jgi:dTMP kinase
MRTNGLLVVIEGIDYSGKTTQTLRLVRALQEAGQVVSSFHFPTAQSELGKLIGRVLSGKHAVPDDTLLALFAANRLEARLPIQQALGSQKVVVCDRYSASEYAYGGAKGLPFSWLEALESRMPAADLCFLLDLDASSAAKRKRKGAARDMFEEDYRFLDAVRQIYLTVAQPGGTSGCRWVIIEADQPEEAIAEQLLTHVAERLRYLG